MPKKTIPCGTIDFASGQMADMIIPRVGLLTELRLKLSYTVTGGATAAEGPKFEAIARLIRSLELTINGRDTIVTIDGPGIVARSRYEKGVAPKGANDTVVLTAEAVTNYQLVLTLPMTLPNCANPMATALPVDKFGHTVLTVNWGTADCADIFTTANGAAISAVTMKVEAEFIQGYGDAPNLVRVLTMQNANVDADNTDFQSVIDTGTPQHYRTIMVAALDGLVASDDVINELVIKTGTYTYEQRDPDILQAHNMNFFKQSTHQTGIYYVQTELMGNPALWWPVARDKMVSDLKFHGNVTKGDGDTKLVLYKEAIRPLSG